MEKSARNPRATRLRCVCRLAPQQSCCFIESVKIVPLIAEKAALAGLEFLVIGGNAVIAYGYPRLTSDVDLLVRETDRRKWDDLILALGYRQHHIHRVFHMYNPIARDLPAVDLMLVNEGTFAKLSDNTTDTELGGVTVRIPSLRNLIALKLHALRQGGEHRHTRDFVDVIELMQLNQVDLAAPDYVEILERYATPAIAAAIRAQYAGPRPSGS